MNNITKTFVTALLAATVQTATAQGNLNGLGNEREQTQSLAERVLKLEKKSDAFNLYLNTHISYQERFNNQERFGSRQSDGSEEGGSFKGRQLRVEMLGNLNEHWSYRFRYRLNRPGEQQSDNFSNNIDIMTVNYKFNDRFTLSAGKLGVALGGYQYDDNPINVLEFCDWLNGIDGFHLGVHGAYNVGKNNTLMLGLYNTNNNDTKRYYSEEAGLKRSKHPLAGSLYWIGNMCGGKLQTLWSYSLLSEVENKYSSLLMLGTRLNMPKWQLTLDYYGAWEQIDHHKIITTEMRAADPATSKVARSTRYHSLLLDWTYQPTPHWNCILGGRMEFASAKDNPAFRNYRRSYGYQAAVQWIPDLTQDARLSLAYIGSRVDYNDKCGLADFNTDRLELSLIYRIKVY